jgi:glucose-6-phosphate 1-dehydrogenase
VRSIQITMAEDFGVRDRAVFYDATGATRDVLQNHLLQALAHLTMDPPTSEVSEALREVCVELRCPPRETFGELVSGGSAYMRFWLGPDMAIGMSLGVKQPGDRMVGDDVELILSAQAAIYRPRISGCSATRCMVTAICSDVRISWMLNGVLYSRSSTTRHPFLYTVPEAGIRAKRRS